MARPYSTRKLDLTGQRYGKFIILGPAENIGRDTAWRCRCDCGAEKTVRTASLRRGKARSCGCEMSAPKLPGTSRLDLSGQRFGRLTAVEPLPKSGEAYKWRCICDCGNECAVAAANLRNGHTQSCGCKSTPHITYVDGTCIEVIRSRRLRSNNTSGCTGVVWHKDIGRWDASICFKGERHYLGLFDNYEDAVKAREEAEARYFGSFLAEYDAKQDVTAP